MKNKVNIKAVLVAIFMVFAIATGTVVSAKEVVHPLKDYDINADGTINILDMVRLKNIILCKENEENDTTFNVMDVCRLQKYLLGGDIENPNDTPDEEFSTSVVEDFNDNDIKLLRYLSVNRWFVEHINGTMVFTMVEDDGNEITFSAKENYGYEATKPIELLACYDREGKTYEFVRDESGIHCFWIEKSNALVPFKGGLIMNLDLFGSYDTTAWTLLKTIGNGNYKYESQNVTDDKVTTVLKDSNGYSIEWTVSVISSDEVELPIEVMAVIINMKEMVDYHIFYDVRLGGYRAIAVDVS